MAYLASNDDHRFSEIMIAELEAVTSANTAAEWAIQMIAELQALWIDATDRNHIHAAFRKLNIQTRTQVMQIDVESTGKLLRETSLILADLTERCKELDTCLRDPVANGYDGTTTRAQWRQSIERAEAFLARGNQ